MLCGPVGCGKSALMLLMSRLTIPENKFVIKSCRQLSFEFMQDGFTVIHRYSRASSYSNKAPIFCFDDFGAETTLKYYGNDCNVMAEILLSRYELFVEHGNITHLTTNLNASELESIYGKRVRSRMRQMFNLISFNTGTKDKRT
jgi:DNA replication protein DnaC